MRLRLFALVLCACAHAETAQTAAFPRGQTPESFPAVNRAVVYELDPENEQPNASIQDWSDWFPVLPHSEAPHVQAKVSLDGARAKAFIEAWRHLRFDDKTQFLCHHPAFGLRFYDHERLIFQTTLCLQCWNYWDADGSWRGIDFRKPEGAAFYAQLRQVFPKLPERMVSNPMPEDVP